MLINNTGSKVSTFTKTLQLVESKHNDYSTMPPFSLANDNTILINHRMAHNQGRRQAGGGSGVHPTPIGLTTLVFLSPKIPDVLALKDLSSYKAP